MRIRNSKLFFIGLALLIGMGFWAFQNRESYVSTYNMLYNTLGPFGVLAMFLSVIVIPFVSLIPWLNKLIDRYLK